MTRITQLSSTVLLLLFAPGCPQTVECRAEIDAYEDLDGDGFGSSLGALGKVCALEAGMSDSPLDCDDTDPLVSPDGVEVCNGVDENCDGQLDETLDRQLYHRDEDGDGFGGFLEAILSCDPPTEGRWARDDQDCDDGDPAINPGAQEVCGGPDEDCDGLPSDTDPSVDPTTMSTFYRDADGDGLGNPTLSRDACALPAGMADNDDDCNDGDDLIGRLYWYADSDLDGFGDPANSTDACRRPDGYVVNNLDCDDADEAANIDLEWYADLDGDRFGEGAVVAIECRPPTPGLVDDVTDCDDTDPNVNPKASELCQDGTDANCDGFDGCSTCQQLLERDPALVDGTYTLELPAGDRQVRCDMTTDGGGWTLVQNAHSPGDFAANYYRDLQGLDDTSTSGASRGVWDGLREALPARTDVRFSCGTDDSDDYAVDVSVYDIFWYREWTTGNDGNSCFNEPGGYDQPAPARKNNLDGAERPSGDDWDSGSLRGEDSCGDSSDFAFDFDTRGKAAGGWGGGDPTSWGVANGTPRCGTRTDNSLTFWLWVR